VFDFWLDNKFYFPFLFFKTKVDLLNYLDLSIEGFNHFQIYKNITKDKEYSDLKFCLILDVDKEKKEMKTPEVFHLSFDI
jgi:hypothetical protein